MVIVPGFNDAHIHLNPQPSFEELHMSGQEPTWDEVRTALMQAVRKSPVGPTLFAEIGSRILDEPSVKRAALDAISITRPIRLNAWTGHGVILNSAGLRLYGIKEDQRDPPGGYYGREANGRLDGRLYEYAGFELRLPMGSHELEEGWRRISQSLAEQGITSVQNMTFGAQRDRAFLAEHPQAVRVRTLEMITEWSDARRPAVEPHQGVKVVVDGTPVERFAAMLRPYADSRAASGRMNLTEAEVCSVLRDAVATRRQALLHVVGDRSAAVALDCMERQSDTNWPAQRVRFEHRDMVTGGLVERARKLGVIVVENPSHFTIGEVLKTRWGTKRAGAAQNARTLVSAGIPFALGSDGLESPYINIMLACMHPGRPSEALTREQAVEAYTRSAAFAEFAESWKGTIEPGKAADLAMLSQDLFTVPLSESPKTSAVLTMVAGRIVHEVR